MAIFGRDGRQWQVTRAGVFLVVGIIAASFITYGVLWLVKERGEQVRRDQAIAIAEQQLQDQSSEPTTTPPQDESSEQSSTSSSQSTPTQNQPAAMPQTGPAETFVAIIGLGAVTYSISAYKVSRQRVRLY